MVAKWAIPLGIAAVMCALSMHQIPEGHVGIYYRQTEITFPTSTMYVIFTRISEEGLSSRR